MDKNEFLKDVIDKEKEVHERALKPCPFCGGRKISLYQIKDLDGYWRHYFRCCACGAQSSVREYPRATCDPDLRELWNNRINEGYTEVKHGKWKQEKCTNCGKSLEDLFEGEFYYDCEEIHFCPNCGAQMDGDNNG